MDLYIKEMKILARIEEKVKVKKPKKEKQETDKKRTLTLAIIIGSVVAVIAIATVVIVLIVKELNEPDLSNKFPKGETITYEELCDLAQFSEHNIYVFVYHADLDEYPLSDDIKTAVNMFIALDEVEDDNAAFFILDLSDVDEDDELINSGILDNEDYDSLSEGPFLVKIKGEKVDEVISSNLYNELIAAMKDFEDLM